MPLFEYEATDANGLQIKAEITADDPMAAIEKLRANGLDVTSIVQKEQGRSKGFFGGIVADIQDSASELRELHDQQFGGSLDRQIERPPDRPVTCGWCETLVPAPVTVANCPNCGGTLPLPPGPDRGPEPPPAPRELPKKFIMKLKYGGFFWFGLIFVIVGLVVAIPTCGFTLIFTAVGGFLMYQGWTTATNRIAALQDGVTTEGEITSVGYDRSRSTNGRHPYLVKYRFEVDGSYREGQKSTWNEAAMDHFRGEPVWVVYIPGETKKCAIWPPMA